MISFEDIDKHSWLYDLYMKYLCAAHNHVYYRNFYIVNRENIPPKGTPTFASSATENTRSQFARLFNIGFNI